MLPWHGIHTYGFRFRLGIKDLYTNHNIVNNILFQLNFRNTALKFIYGGLHEHGNHWTLLVSIMF